MSQQTEEPTFQIIAEKINWLSSRQTVYCVDVHPDNSRFLTASADMVNIWRATSHINSTKSHRDESITETELTSSSSSKVTTIKTNSDFSIQKITNSGNVSCARFSPDGNFMAAACDDSTVSVHKVLKANTDKENWKNYKYFQTHRGDVLSLAWSGDSRYLATCSVDNSVIVYDMKAKIIGDIVLRSFEHGNFVKGVSFDPIGKYFVSQADDSVIIWTLNDGIFTIHKKITDGFSRVHGMNYKASFSPCGQYLVIPNGQSRGSHCANIYLRHDNFDQPIPFYCLRSVWFSVFNPVIFKKNNKTGNIFAISTDNAVFIYASDVPKPMVHVSHISKQAITDITWSADGLSLLVSCSDGSVHSINFPVDFLGSPLNAQERKVYLEQFYGDMEIGSVLPEYPNSIFSIHQPVNPQAPQPNPFSHSDASTTTATPVGTASSSSTTTNLTKPTPVVEPKPKTTPVVEQRVEIVNGKKRIVPVHTSFDDDDEDEEETVQKPINFSINLEKESLLNNVMSNRGGVNAVETSIGFESPPLSYSTADILRVNTEVTKKRTRIDPEDRTTKKNKKKTKTPINPLRDLSTISAEPIYLRLNSRDELFCSIEGIIEVKRNSTLKWKSTVSGTGSVLHSYPVQAAGTDFFVAVCTFPSNQCHVFSTETGMRLLPPMVLDSKIEHTNCSGDYLAAYTAELMFYVWDVRKQKCLVRCSADSLLSNSSTVSVEKRIVDDIAVTAKGVGIVTLMSGESFAYDTNLNTWICVADSHSVFSPFLSQGRVDLDEIEESNEDVEVTLKVLRNKAARAVQKFRLEHPEVTPTTETANIDIIDDLEIAMTSAAAIGDFGSYMYAVQSYAKHLAKIKDDRLKDLFRSLLGPYTSKSTHWDPFVAGTPKRMVLQHLVTLLSAVSEISIKRLCSEYAVILSNIRE